MTLIQRLVARFKEEPTLVVQLVQIVLSLLVAFEAVVLSESQAGAILGITSAAMGLIIGLSVRPFQWPLVMGLVNSGFVLGASFGLDFTAQQTAMVSTAVAFLGTLLVRYKVTPETKIAAPVIEGHALSAPSRL